MTPTDRTVSIYTQWAWDAWGNKHLVRECSDGTYLRVVLPYTVENKQETPPAAPKPRRFKVRK